MLCTHDISSTGWGETRPGTERQNSGLLGSRPSAEVAEVAQEREFVGTQNTHRHFSSLFSSSFSGQKNFYSSPGGASYGSRWNGTKFRFVRSQLSTDGRIKGLLSSLTSRRNISSIQHFPFILFFKKIKF